VDAMLGREGRKERPPPAPGAGEAVHEHEGRAGPRGTPANELVRDPGRLRFRERHPREGKAAPTRGRRTAGAGDIFVLTNTPTVTRAASPSCGPGRRAARNPACTSARARDRRAPARHRQALGAGETLQKPGKLDDDEFELVRRHPARGDSLLGELGFSRRVRGLVRDHHERLDGTGYPHGSAASRLPLEVRVLTACDVYDALRSRRVYREAWDHQRALALLRAETGTAFDARCVDALERVRARDAVAAPVAIAV